MKPLENSSKSIHSKTGTNRSLRVVRSSESEEIFALTSRMAKGDGEAFNTFYRAYFDRVHRYLLVLSRGWEEVVNDALQDAMLRTVRYIKPFHDEDAFWNWLRRIAKTALIDLARRRKSSDMVVSLSTVESMAADESHDDPSSELKGYLSLCLAELKKEDRAIIEGKYMEGKSYEELAGDLHISAKAVESRLARIRKKLKSKILERMKNDTRSKTR